ncbi:Phosphatidylinositol (PI) 3-kinase [Exophiala dermatitidis]|uniref:Phosphatidylinositol 3-kinase VPS34 n=1 Tax=Exophiala dermatitidis TaxID=5970 RepID=A0AAN6F0H3_EXODE|nr:Phosphatidylinositol (PI) 3-kinase [Exophiala dermatitidis]KAJ4519251.1 Phosphatidylinositol (PI) 3-kinase [Exophiala dermatitidis]KAJ4529067.1 Phosphatidylinositol (PI) 3-kinase [Exophiala dermatitidis]KAJ4538465.1 Phosphatidylinositol (PI) 3-kinase [Exophiala dermatitidis]KAJ4544288.1 Phosphatidylinositol (PI) 3-kinase [Exophiala dermatitidis]
MDTYTFATSRQIDFPVCIRINNLEGKQTQVPQSVLLKHPEIRHVGSVQSPTSELYVTAQLWAESKPLGVSTQTPHMFFKNSRTWNKWLELPVLVKDCPISSQVAITIWDLCPCPTDGSLDHAVPFGGTTIPLFDNDGALRKGRQKCRVHRHKAADGQTPSSTPHIPRPKRRRRNCDPPPPIPEEEELERLEQLFKKHEMNEIPQNDWLDQLVFQCVGKKAREVEEAARKRSTLHKASKRKSVATSAPNGTPNGGTGSDDESESEGELDDDERFTLYVDFARWDFPVVFEDHEYQPPKMMREFQYTLSSSAIGNSKPPPEVRYGPGIAAGNSIVDDEDYPVIQIFDPEQFQKENPCETKHRRLVRSDRNAYSDADQKPNAKLRDELNEILSYGPTQELSPQEKDVVWTFRRYLSRDKRALTKVVKATDWTNPGEVRQLTELIPKWAKIDVDSALELLGPTYDSPVVRAYAVDRLRQADDDELLLYLLQLVQALKFEKYETKQEGLPSSSLARFLIDRASNNFILGNYLHWFLMVECDDKGPDTNAANRKLFARVEYHFMLELEKRDSDQRKTLLRQAEMIAILSRISKEIRFSRSNRISKIESLKKYLADPKNELVKIDPPIPLPLDPEVEVSGVYPEEANVFKSSLSPLLIHFKVASSPNSSATSTQPRSQCQGRYPIIFKTGDDLRQDQLVIQIITLMNNLLLKENLDLKLTPYRILATSPSAGAVQFIASTPISAISTKYRGSVLAYLRANNPDSSGPLGVRKETMDTYIRSCAGYCVITYILGVGDRHLDNLLLQPSGHFFHIDFGFILGRDPKPFAPLIKLCKEMVEGLGGTTSPQYAQFKQYCFTAYTTLRKSSSLVLNLFSLMVQSSVQDIRLVEEQLGTVGGAVGKVRERFHLDVSEEEAVRMLDQVLADSVNAVFGVVIDRLHEFVQGWRA